MMSPGALAVVSRHREPAAHGFGDDAAEGVKSAREQQHICLCIDFVEL